MRDPYTDLEINCRSQLSILEPAGGTTRRQGRVRGHAPVYGKPEFLPVTEQHWSGRRT